MNKGTLQRIRRLLAGELPQRYLTNVDPLLCAKVRLARFLKLTANNSSAGSNSSKCISAVTAADNDFCMQLAVMARSIVANASSSTNINLYVLCDQIEEEKREKVEAFVAGSGLRIIWKTIDTSRVSEFESTKWTWISSATFFRLCIGDALPEDVDKIIYLDADLILNCDIARLWDIEFFGCDLFAVQEQNKRQKTLSSFEGVKHYKDYGLDGELKYFNAGVLVLSLKRWRKEAMAERAIEYLNTYRDAFNDQEALNCVFAGKWKELDPRWNVMTHAFWPANYEKSYDKFLFDPYIIHFTTEKKPWIRGNYHPYGDLFFKYLDQTEWKGWRPK